MGSALRSASYLALTLGVALLWTNRASAAWEPLFRGTQFHDVGSWTATSVLRSGVPHQIAAGDLNGDGRPDLVAVNTFDSLPPLVGNTISVLLHSADVGSPSAFLPKASYPTADGPASIELADMNLDGALDAIVCSTNPLEVCVMLGVGDGSFGPPGPTSQVPIQDSSLTGRYLAVGDVNQDGLPDVLAYGHVVEFQSEGRLAVLLGTGGGDLGPPVVYDVNPTVSGDEPLALALGELTGDGNLDVVIAGITGSSLLQGDGAGGFTFQSNLLMTDTAHDVAITNLNGDSIRDLVFAADGAIHVLIGTGGGNYLVLAEYPQSHHPLYLEVGDLDLDGKQDVVSQGGDQVSVLHGNGNGTLGAAAYYSTHRYAGDIRLVDMDLNGRLDLVGAASGFEIPRIHAVWMIVDDGAGGFRAAATTVPFLSSARFPAVADFDRNGKLDVAVAGNNRIEIALGNGDGTFVGMFGGNAATPGLIVTGDWNRDGRADIAFQSGTSIVGWWGVGTGGFSSVLAFGISGYSLHRRSVADMNRDGLQDLVVTESNGNVLRVLTQNADGTFFVNTGQSISSFQSFVLGDWNGDGKTDVAVTAGTPVSTVTLILGNGDGTFGSRRIVRVDRLYADLCAGDFNRDGKLDLAMLETLAGQSGLRGIDVSLGDGAGGFLGVPSIPTLEQNGYYLESWDVNLDGHPDLVASQLSDRPVDPIAIERAASAEVLLGNGTGQFGPRLAYALGVSTAIPSSIQAPLFAVGDVNRDDLPDILSTPAGTRLQAMLATPPDFGNTLGPRVDHTMSAGTRRVALGDLNRDGVQDVVATSISSLVTVRLGTIQGTLGAASTVPQSLAALEVDLADVNRDGKLDLLLVGTNEIVTCLLGNGDGTFGPRIDHAGTAGVFDLAVADMNRDGRPDLVIGRYDPGLRYVKILLGNGDGTFAANPLQLSVLGPWIYDIEIVDVNRDNLSDIVMAAGELRVVFGNGLGGFSGGYTVNLGSTTLQRVCSADFDRDGYVDVAASDLDGAVKVAWGSAGPAFSTYVSSATPGSAWDLHAGQTERDGRWFLYLSTLGSNKVVLMQPGVTPGIYVTAGTYDAGNDPEGLALGDLNRDGLLDVFTANSADGTVSVFSGPSTITTGVAAAVVPKARARLDQNVPNPFNPETTIRFAVPEAGPVELSVYDVQGRVVSKLIDGTVPVGEHSVRWSGRTASGSPAASGVYYYRLRTAQDEESRRMVLVK